MTSSARKGAASLVVADLSGTVQQTARISFLRVGPFASVLKCQWIDSIDGPLYFRCDCCINLWLGRIICLLHWEHSDCFFIRSVSTVFFFARSHRRYCCCCYIFHCLALTALSVNDRCTTFACRGFLVVLNVTVSGLLDWKLAPPGASFQSTSYTCALFTSRICCDSLDWSWRGRRLTMCVLRVTFTCDEVFISRNDLWQSVEHSMAVDGYEKNYNSVRFGRRHVDTCRAHVSCHRRSVCSERSFQFWCRHSSVNQAQFRFELWIKIKLNDRFISRLGWCGLCCVFSTQ